MKKIDKAIGYLTESVRTDAIRDAIIESSCPEEFGLKNMCPCIQLIRCKECWNEEVEDENNRQSNGISAKKCEGVVSQKSNNRNNLPQ